MHIKIYICSLPVTEFPKVHHLIRSKIVETGLAWIQSKLPSTSLPVPAEHYNSVTFLATLEQCMTSLRVESEKEMYLTK
jgi:hypothetical protein